MWAEINKKKKKKKRIPLAKSSDGDNDDNIYSYLIAYNVVASIISQRYKKSQMKQFGQEMTK